MLSRISSFALLTGLALALAPGQADAQVVAWCDTTTDVAITDGAIAADEYPGASTGINAGFGTVIGAGTQLHIDSGPAGELAFAFEDTTGVGCELNDQIVVYLDTIPGAGFESTATFNDTGDLGRAAISGASAGGDRADLTFAAGFGADFAIAIDRSGANLFRLGDVGGHVYLETLTKAPADADVFAAACVRELGGISMRDLGSQVGNPIHWVATLINATNAFRSNEFQGVADGTAPDNIGAAPFTLPDGSRNIFESDGPPVGFSGPFAWVDFGPFAGDGFSPTPTCGQVSSESLRAEGFSFGTGSVAFGGTADTDDFARGDSATVGTTTAGVYAFEVAPNDRAMGAIPTGSEFTPGAFTMRIRNDAATTITSVDVSYRALVFNHQPRSNSLELAFSTDGADFTDLPGLGVVSPEAADATPAWVGTDLGTTLAGLAIGPGEYLYLRWRGDDVAGSGNRDRLAIDDVVARPTFSTCGDAVLDAGEACDDGATNGATACGCQVDCSLPAEGFACGGAGDLGVCDLADSCDGAGACVDRVSSGTLCLASAGPCDPQETCNGVDHDCPADARSPADTMCALGDPTMACDADDLCDGTSAECPSLAAAAGDSCRDSTGTCDLGASCDGTSLACPASVPAAVATPCRASSDVCDVPEACDGTLSCPADLVALAGEPCRDSAGACDAAEACDGSSKACPADAPAADGTSCGDGEACNGAEVCASGVCGATPVDCDDSDACTTDMCAEPGGACTNAAIAGCCNLGTDCDDSDVCTVDSCTGPGGTCDHASITNCCVSDSDCGDASACTTDTCDTSTDRCVFTAIPSCCATVADCDDGNLCTTDACGSGGTCEATAIVGCCLNDGDCDDGDACTADACGADDMCSNTGIADCCATASDCDDADACTTDSCDPSTDRCAHADACTTDGGVPDAGPDDGGTDDAGPDDAGPEDAGPDAGSTDAGTPDAGAPDAGTPDVMGGGCSCRAAGSAPSGPSGAGLWMLALGLVFRRVRARRRA